MDTPRTVKQICKELKQLEKIRKILNASEHQTDATSFDSVDLAAKIATLKGMIIDSLVEYCIDEDDYKLLHLCLIENYPRHEVAKVLGRSDQYVYDRISGIYHKDVKVPPKQFR
jgi:hypothetical protein